MNSGLASSQAWFEPRVFDALPIFPSSPAENSLCPNDDADDSASLFAGDGNCMFRAAADQLFANDEKHMEVRAIATQYLADSLLSTWPPSFKTLNCKGCPMLVAH
jgi:hypothetical protein